MKSKMIRLGAAALALTMTAALAGCGAAGSNSASTSGSAASEDVPEMVEIDYSKYIDENGFWKDIHALDYVTLPEYKGVEVPAEEIEPTEEEIQSEIDSLLSDHATEKQVTDRAAADGDTVNIDYAGSVDGVAFSGGTYSGYSLTLGSGTFIDGFEDQIVGHTPGETFDVTVTFPEGYSDSTDSEGNTVVLSGKKAVFSVTLNYISEKVLPELTDAWVAENYGESDDVHTVEELKALYQKMLYNTNLQNAIMDDLLANSTFKELPSEITSYYIRMFLNYYNQYATAYGMDLNAFAQTQGYTDADAMLAASDAYFEHLAKQDLILQAVAETKSLAPTQEELDDAESTYADTYGENRAHLNALQSCVLDWLEENSTVA